MRDKANKKNLRQAFASRSLRAGSYSLAVCAVALVIAVLVNLIAGTLPVRFTELDLSNNELFSLSDYSQKIVQNLDTDVMIYHLTTAANEDTRLSTLLRRYADQSSHIRVETRDPQISQIASKYTKDEVTENSLIFVSDKRSKFVDYSSIMGYSEQAQMYAMYGQNVSPDEFNGEREITTALNYVSTDVLPKVYTLTGHGEFELPTLVQTSVSSENIELIELDLTQKKDIPQDCACLIVLSPDSDISQKELSAVEDYFNAGGKLMISTRMKSELQGETPNFDALLADLGFEAGDSFVIEGESSMYYYYPNFLVPQMQNHGITDPIIESKYHVYFPNARVLSVSEKNRSSLEITPLLTTSDSAFGRSDMTNASAEKAPGDIDGPFNAAYAVEESMDGQTANAVVFSSASFLDEGYGFIAYPGNMNLFLNSLKWMCDLEENISVVETKSLADNGQLEVDNSSFLLWGAILTLVVPSAVLIAGIVVFVKRKKR